MGDILHPKIYNIDRYVLACDVHKPTGKGPFPAVVLLPGFMGYKDEHHLVALAEHLAKNGYLAIRFDPTGSGKSEGTIEYDYRLSTYLNDIDTIVTYLKHQDLVKPNAIGLWGHSMGGMLAIIYAAEYDVVKAIGAVSPPMFIGSSTWMKELIPEWEKKGKVVIETASRGKISVPDAFLRDARKYNALTSVKELKQPILVVVGKADDVVLPKDTMTIFEAAHEPKQFLEIMDMKHDYAEVPEQVTKINEETTAFFDTYLK